VVVVAPSEEGVLRHEKECRWCGKELSPPASYRRKVKRFCNLHCHTSWAAANPLTKNCEFCATPFLDFRRHPSAKFCSTSCARDDWQSREVDGRSCRFCPREEGENRMVSRVLCHTCWVKREKNGTCMQPSCQRIMRRRGFGKEGPSHYCAKHEGFRLWRGIKGSIRVLLVDADTGMFRVTYRLRYTEVNTPDWSGNLHRVANDRREAVALVDHDAFVARDVKWAHAFKDHQDPEGFLDRVPWWAFLADDLYPSASTSLRNFMGVCLRAGRPTYKQAFHDAQPDKSKSALDRNWERFKVRIREYGIPYTKHLRPETGDVGIGFDPHHWESFCAYVDQRALQRQEKSLWV